MASLMFTVPGAIVISALILGVAWIIVTWLRRWY